jgi:SpoIID/LytB domain protein
MVLARRAAAAVAAGIVLAAGGAVEARADEPVAPVNSAITVTTLGWGHGVGMSQYGAYGAAKSGLDYAAILAFYYPGTTLDQAGPATLRVWIKDDADGQLNVVPAAGLRVKDGDGKVKVLPVKASKYTQWRVQRSGSKRLLYYRNAKGRWVKYNPKLNAKTLWRVYNPKSKTVQVVLPSGSTRTYRGKLQLSFSGSSAITVNRVGLEDYLRGVVASEMPPNWSPEALRAQAVAARSYALRYKANLKGARLYDICDTTACQAYLGAGNEDYRCDAAIADTAGQVVGYQGAIAYTMFTSANGGQTVAGDYPYLVAQPDPYDGLVVNQYHPFTITAAQLEKKYPSIGRFESISVARDGVGEWGGRVQQVFVAGSAGVKTVSAASFKSAFGLRERWFNVTGGLAKGTGNYERWMDERDVNGPIGVPTGSEQVIGEGLYAPFTGGGLYWSQATGSRFLHGAVEAAYLANGGPQGALGWPTTDVVKPVAQTLSPVSGYQAEFTGGWIVCAAEDADPATCQVGLS